MSKAIDKVEAFVLARRAYNAGDFSSYKRMEAILVNSIEEDGKNDTYSQAIQLDDISMKLFNKYRKITFERK